MADEAWVFWSPVEDQAALEGGEGAHGEWRPGARGYAREAGSQDGDADLSSEDSN